MVTVHLQEKACLNTHCQVWLQVEGEMYRYIQGDYTGTMVHYLKGEAALEQ